jgi:hypothetical protein
MKKIIVILLLSTLTIGCKNNQKGSPTENKQVQVEHKEDKKTEKKKEVLSPHTSTMAMIGDTHIRIDYSSPGVRNRIVFGGLLPYDMVWQAGAHNATWFETNKDLTIDGKTLKTGKYGFFTIPSKDEWILIFNSNWDQHGKDEYDEKDDILRFTIKPEILDDITEHLVYNIDKIDETHGIVSLSWEKVTLKFNFETKN